MRWISAVLASLALSAPATAWAQSDAGDWYGSAAGTISFLKDTEGTIANAPAPGSTVRTEHELETGYGFQVALGRTLGAFRIEAEVGYTRNEQDHYVAIIPPTGRIPADVFQEALRGMANVYYDFSIGDVRPFIGAGLGIARIDVEFVAPRAPFPTEAPRELINDTDTRFAYQLMAGAALPVNARTALFAQYRWFDAGRFRGLDSRGERAERDHVGHNIDIGLRVSF